jgi:hypothetical protein
LIVGTTLFCFELLVFRGVPMFAGLLVLRRRAILAVLEVKTQ